MIAIDISLLHPAFAFRKNVYAVFFSSGASAGW